MDGHFLKKIVLFFICCLINCSLEQALFCILDAHFSNPGKKPAEKSFTHKTSPSFKNSEA